MKQQVIGVCLFLLSILFSVSFNNCMGGAADTRPVPRIGEELLATNALVWRPNRLASFTCSRYQDTDSVYNSFKFPTFFVWQTQNNPGPNVSTDKLSSDPYAPGFGLSDAAKAFLKEHELTALADIKHFLPTNLSPFLYYQARGPTSTGSGLVVAGKSDWAINGAFNGPYYTYVDTKNQLSGSVLNNIALKKKVNLNPMGVFGLPKTVTHKDGYTYLGLGFRDPAGKMLRSLYTFLLPAGEANPEDEVYVGGETLQVRVNGHVLEGSNSQTREADVIIATDTFGDTESQRGLTVDSAYYHYWVCTYYFVTHDTTKCVKDGDPEPDSPIALGPLAVKGYFGKYKGINCFAVTDLRGSPRCYSDSIKITKGQQSTTYDPITMVEQDPNHELSAWAKSPTPWRVDNDKTAVAWLSYCRRITEKK